MRGSVRNRIVAASAALAGGAILLAGPAASVALNVGSTTTSLTGQAGTSTPASTAVAGHARSSATRSHVRQEAARSAQSPPVDATVEGTNPHGQGTVLAVSLAGHEAVVVGRSRGEQRSDGSYHGHTTTLGLFGNDVIGNDTTSGQTAKGPLAPLQEQVLDQICKGSSGNVCVDVLRADSTTTANGSTNHSRLVGVMLGGQNGAVAEAGDSNGNIQSNGDCQHAHGDVTLLKLMLGGNPLLDIGESASDSNSCPSGTTVTNSSNPLVAVGGQQIPLPGCGANAPGNLVDASPLITIACNAGAATGSNGIVNDALAGTVLASGSGPVATLSGAGTGAAATSPGAPSQAVLGTRQAGPGKKSAGKTSSTSKHGNGANKNASGRKGEPATPASASSNRPLSATRAGKLPYTGSDVVLALLIACCLLAGGLGVRRLDTTPQR